jgi:hypothetical protein
MFYGAIDYLAEYPEKNSKTLKTWVLKHPFMEDVMVIRSYPDRSCVTIFREKKILVFERQFTDSPISGGLLHDIITGICMNDTEKTMEYFSSVSSDEMDNNRLMHSLEEAGDGNEYSR